MPIPVINTAYVFFASVSDTLNPAEFKVAPTIAEGDFTASLDGAAFANLTNLPVVLPAGSSDIQITVAIDEMSGGGKLTIFAKDQAGDEWEEKKWYFDIPTGSTETINDLQEGDRIESSTNMVINKKDTATEILNKDITGSLLSPGVTISTKEGS